MRLAYRYGIVVLYSYVCITVLFYYSYLSGISTNVKHRRKDVPRAKFGLEAYTDLSNTEELQKLGVIVHQRLKYIQNPDSCKSRKKVQCQIHPCGFGCTVNTISNCLMIAYALNRTVVAAPQPGYRLKPLSANCLDRTGKRANFFSEDYESYQVITIGILFNKYKPDFYPPAVPEDLFKRIRRYHDDPFLWWTSQISSYVFQFKDNTYQKLLQEDILKEFIEPIVGVQVRRSDKLILEAKFHAIDEYMIHVEKWFKDRPSLKPRVFLATDDQWVLQDLTERYPNYDVISNMNHTLAATPGNRGTLVGQYGIIHDIYFLSKCDFLVCTFSSNVCRLAYQLMTAERGNVSHMAVSIDRPWYFYGQRELGVMRTAKMPSYPDKF